MPPALTRIGLTWAVLLVLASGLLLLGQTPGTPEFVVTVMTLGIGVVLGVGIILAIYLTRRAERRSLER